MCNAKDRHDKSQAGQCREVYPLPACETNPLSHFTHQNPVLVGKDPWDQRVATST